MIFVNSRQADEGKPVIILFQTNRLVAVILRTLRGKELLLPPLINTDPDLATLVLFLVFIFSIMLICAAASSIPVSKVS